MSPQLTGELVSAAIPFCFGILVLLQGLRVIGKKSGVSPKYDHWHSRYGRLMKLCGPALMLFGLFLAFNAFATHTTQATQWQRHASSDGKCSAEFPGQPNYDTKSALGVVSHRVTLSRSGTNSSYLLTYSDTPLGDNPPTDDQRLDVIRDGMPALGDAMNTKLVLLNENRFTENGIRGSEMKFTAGKDLSLRVKVYIHGPRVYRIITVAPRTNPHDNDAKHFIDSFQFE